MWGKVKVGGCLCGARSVRWRNAHVGQGRYSGGIPRWGQGHAMVGRPDRPVLGSREGPMWAVLRGGRGPGWGELWERSYPGGAVV